MITGMGNGPQPQIMKPMAAPAPIRAMSPSFAQRGEARAMGGLRSHVPGRTDHLPIKVPSGSYVMPADVVSGLGQGNTQAGMHVLDRMFKTGPYGLGQSPTRVGHLASPHLSYPKHFAAGGEVKDDVPIMAAGGEYVVPPEHVAAIGAGDIAHGHDILDQFVKNARQKTISDMQNLPGPAND